MSTALSETELATLLAIAGLTKPRGPSTSEVAVVTGLSRFGVLKIARRLVAGGILAGGFDKGGSNRLDLTPSGRRVLTRIRKRMKGNLNGR